MNRIFLALLITSGISFGASKPLLIRKCKHKRKSLTTAQLYKKGPFMGSATLASASPTVFN